MENAVTDKEFINIDRLSFINKINIEELDPRSFTLFKQLVCLAKLWSIDQEQDKLDFDELYNKITSLPKDKLSEFINEDPATHNQK